MQQPEGTRREAITATTPGGPGAPGPGVPGPVVARSGPAIVAASAPPGEDRVSTPWPLVGRQDESRILRESLLSAGAGGVVIYGDAGVGKTRLAMHALDEAGHRGCDVEWAVATGSASTVPFGVFAHLARTDHPFPSRTELLVQLTDGILRRSRTAPVIVAVDDAHLLDEGAAAFVHAVVTRRLARVVLTVRSDRHLPDGLASLWRDDRLMRIDLTPLGYDDVDTLLEGVLGGPVDSATRRRLGDWCGGNPLYLRELLHAGVETDALAQIEGVWRWRGETVISDRLATVIEARLDRVTEEEGQLLDALALAEPISITILDRWGGQAALEALERRGLIDVDTSDASEAVVRLGHPLYGETIRSRVPALARRRVLSALAGEILARPQHSPDDLFRATVWLLDSGGSVHPQLLIAAAQRAAAAFSYDLTERLARRALESGAGVDALLLLGHALYWTNRYRECDSALCGVSAFRPTERQLGEAAVIRSSALFWGLDEVEAAEAVLTSAAARLTDPDAVSAVASQRATFRVWSGRPGDAITLARTVTEAPAAEAVSRLRAVIAMALSEAVDGNTERAAWLTAAEMETATVSVVESPLAVGELLAVQAAARWLGYQFPAANELAAEVNRWCLENNEETMRGIFTLIQGQAVLGAGDVHTAVRLLREAVSCLSQQDPGRAAAWASAALAAACAQMGDAASAARAAGQAREAARRATALLDPLVGWGEAWAAACEGSVTMAGERMAATALEIRGRGMRAVEVFVLIEATRVGGARLAEPRLTELAADLATPSALAGQALAAGIAGHQAGLLVDAADRFAALGASLVAAEAAGLASQEFRRMGRTGSAAALASRSRLLLAGCPGASSPALAQTREAWADPLTPREREIAMLAAGGLSSPGIAERLQLSTRTVDNHLARSYTKLGVAGRGQLARLLASPDRSL